MKYISTFQIWYHITCLTEAKQSIKKKKKLYVYIAIDRKKVILYDLISFIYDQEIN